MNWTGSVLGIDPAPSITTYQAKGAVRNLSLDRHTVVVRHDTIPGYMPQMTMEFTVLDSGELDGISPGDEITFQLVVTKDAHWIESIRRVKTASGSSHELWDSKAVGVPVALKPGDPMPDHELLSEYGKPARFSDFRGKVLAFTFIFSRCPLPDFCPRMSKNFEQARSLLKSESSSTTNWQFLSISFDPEFDRPAILARYAHSYRGEETNGWLFASATTNVLSGLSGELDLQVTRDGGGFSHNLRTIILDPSGRIHREFEGNKWTAKELVDAMKEAAALQSADKKTGLPTAGTNR